MEYLLQSTIIVRFLVHPSVARLQKFGGELEVTAKSDAEYTWQNVVPKFP